MAIVGNGLLTVLKFVAFVLTGSGAMMSEAVHSAADTANQGLLYFGAKRSMKPPDRVFQYGYGNDRYVFALMSAMGIFILGCGVTMYHGIHTLLHPAQLTTSWVSYAVLGAAVVLDGYVLLVAIREVNRSRGGKSFVAFVKESTDPTLLAVLFEDFLATMGALIAMGGIALSNATGNPIYDAITSVIIASLLGLMAIWLGWRNRQLILGPAIPEETQSDVIDFLNAQPSVGKVRKLRTRIVAADIFRIAVEIDYNGTFMGKRHADWLRRRAQAVKDESEWEQLAGEFGDRLMEDLGDEVDKVEKLLAERYPGLQHIDMEAN